jgi:hypothetical protein
VLVRVAKLFKKVITAPRSEAERAEREPKRELLEQGRNVNEPAVEGQRKKS